MSKRAPRSLSVTFIGLEHAHGLVIRVQHGRLEIDASRLPSCRDQQAMFDADPADFRDTAAAMSEPAPLQKAGE